MIKYNMWTPAYRLVRLPPHLIASTSRCHWESRRAFAWNPLDWFKSQVSPRQREKDGDREVEEARQQLRKAGASNIFDTVQEHANENKQISSMNAIKKSKPKPDHHKYSTGLIKTSHRKLNLLANQISQKPVDSAILQMVFSEKRPSTRIKNMLVVARNHAIEKGLARDKLVIAEAWVNKGPGGRENKILEPKGRMKMGIRQRYYSRMHVVLKEGLTIGEKKKAALEKKVHRVASAGLVREDVPLRNPAPMWAW